MKTSDNKTSVTVGPGLPSLLTVAFVVLKLTGYIAWSWWWVFSPLWISAAIGLAILIVILVIAFLATILSK